MLSKDTTRVGQDLINSSEFPSLAHVFNTSSLDGSQGSNRENEAKCQIAASNDWQAIQAWRAAYNNSTSTARLYQMESERFLLFCVLHLKKALSSINRDDIESYHQFLGDPQPRDYWCAPRAGGRQRRGEAGWRPFAGPLSASSRATALSVIQSLFEFLVNARYLSFNPFSLIKRRLRMINNVATHFKQKQQRDIQLEEWRILLATMDEYPETEAKELFYKKRLRLIIVLLYFLGLRVDELVSQTWSAFQKDREGLWWFYLIGKGSKPRILPVPDELLREIIRYRHFLNLTPLPAAQESGFIITDVTHVKSLTVRHLHYIFKNLAEKTAQKFIHDADKATRIRQFSPHWLRHFSASMQKKCGLLDDQIQANLGHTDARTTQGYLHEIDKSRFHAMQKMRLIVK